MAIQVFLKKHEPVRPGFDSERAIGLVRGGNYWEFNFPVDNVDHDDVTITANHQGGGELIHHVAADRPDTADNEASLEIYNLEPGTQVTLPKIITAEELCLDLIARRVDAR